MDKIKLTETPLKGAFLLKPNKYEDHRGSFSRVFCRNEFSEIFSNNEIVQINHSITVKKGSVRGLHFQYPPNAEIKIIKCIKGKVFDVIVDVRENSPTFLSWYGVILSCQNMKSIYIPKGFAHGFQTMESNTELLYLHSEVYEQANEGGLNPNDPSLNIKWPMDISNISEKDQKSKLIEKNFKGIVL